MMYQELFDILADMGLVATIPEMQAIISVAGKIYIQEKAEEEQNERTRVEKIDKN